MLKVHLVLQILEITNQAILCLNLMDEAERNNIKIDQRSLSRELGIPVVPAVASQKKGMDELIQTIEAVATGKYVCRPRRIKNLSPKLDHAVSTLSKKLLEKFPDVPNLNWVSLRLLEGDQSIVDAVRTGDLGKLHDGLMSA